MIEYWAWWKGALALGGTTVVFVLLLDRMLGVSGSWSTIVNWREERKRQKTSAGMSSNAATAHNALLAATLAEFGAQKMDHALANQGLAEPSSSGLSVPVHRARWTTHLTFLLAMMAAGFLAAVVNGQFAFQFDLGEVHTRLFGTGWREWLTLVFGGVLVGFGTQMGSGCTSGHGLSGVSRLEPTSLIATATFFGSAVAISFLLEVAAK